MARETDRTRDTAKQPEPIDRLIDEATGLVAKLAERAVGSVERTVTSVTKRLTDYAELGGPGLLSAVTGKARETTSAAGETVRSAASDIARKAGSALGIRRKGAGKQGGGRGKVTNIVESIQVGVPIAVAYDQWTQFADYPNFMKTVEDVDAVSAEKLEWTAKIGWSRRNWTAEILEQVPEERIVWRSSGAKGSVDGAVTFHELAPSLTHIELVLEYFPKGLFERSANLIRVQGRRARRELRHFQRHVTTHTILHADELEGWRGEIHEGELAGTAGKDDAGDNGRRRTSGTPRTSVRSRSRTGNASGTKKSSASTTKRRTTTQPRQRRTKEDS